MNYYVQINGVIKGPFPIEKLIEEGVKKHTRVCIEGSEDWEIAEDVSELNDIWERKIIYEVSNVKKENFTSISNKTKKESTVSNEIEKTNTDERKGLSQKGLKRMLIGGTIIIIGLFFLNRFFIEKEMDTEEIAILKKPNKTTAPTEKDPESTTSNNKIDNTDNTQTPPKEDNNKIKDIESVASESNKKIVLTSENKDNTNKPVPFKPEKTNQKEPQKSKLNSSDISSNENYAIQQNQLKTLLDEGIKFAELDRDIAIEKFTKIASLLETTPQLDRTDINNQANEYEKEADKLCEDYKEAKRTNLLYIPNDYYIYIALLRQKKNPKKCQ